VAVGEGATGIILVHNHPSGDPTPSGEDRAVTRQLADAGRVIGIPVLDHVVIGRGRYVSLASELM
jgi:DNA repair protein RadC